MRSKKSSVGIIILIAVLMLGIGYAAISSTTLNINGTAAATTSDSNFVVKFDDTVEPPTTKTRDESTVAAAVESDLVATIDVSGLTTTGDKATATYTILNNSPELSADLSVSTIVNSNSEYFKATAELAKNTIASKETTTVEVTVELIKTPIEDQEATFTIPIVADPVTK